jgi:hypothetical protein
MLTLIMSGPFTAQYFNERGINPFGYDSSRTKHFSHHGVVAQIRMSACGGSDFGNWPFITFVPRYFT